MTDTKTTLPIQAKKSYKDGHVAISVRLRCSGWRGDSSRIDGTTDVTITQAREIIAALTEQIDKSEAKIAAKSASEERRRKWREREIAAGRIIVVGGRA